MIVFVMYGLLYIETIVFVLNITGKKGQYEVLVQGGVIEDLGKHLVQQYGIPKKYIEILDKTKR